MIFFLKIIPLFIKFFIEELKIFRIRIINFFVFFNEINFLNLLFQKVASIKNLNIFKINDINNFIRYNNKTINKNFEKDPLKKKYL